MAGRVATAGRWRAGGLHVALGARGRLACSRLRIGAAYWFTASASSQILRSRLRGRSAIRLRAFVQWTFLHLLVPQPIGGLLGPILVRDTFCLGRNWEETRSVTVRSGSE